MLCVVYLQLERTANIRADDQHQYIFHNHHTKKGILQHFHLIFKSALKDSDRHALVVLREEKGEGRGGPWLQHVCLFLCWPWGRGVDCCFTPYSCLQEKEATLEIAGSL